jgi:hypothetical protein
MNERNVPHVRLARIARVREENTDPSPLITPARVSAPATVTVIIPTYQAASTLDRAIASVLHQSLRSLELIVGDDASTDATRMVTQRWYLADPRVRLLNHARTLGKSAVMNNAVPFAQGEWIAVLDADDRYEPRRLERLVAMGDGAEVEMVADNQVIHDAIANADVGVAWRTPARNRDPAWRLTLDGYMQGSDVYEAFNFGMLKPLIRREFVRRTGLAYDTRARYGEDSCTSCNSLSSVAGRSFATIRITSTPSPTAPSRGSGRMSAGDAMTSATCTSSIRRTCATMRLS